MKTDIITRNCPTTPVKLQKEVKKLSPNKYLLFSPKPEKVTWTCTKANKNQERSIYKYHILNLDQNCHAVFGKHHFDTSGTINQDNVHANIELQLIKHYIQSDFSFGEINDKNLENMFKKVEKLEAKAPETMKDAEKIIKEMDEDVKGYKFLGHAEFQSFWGATSHIFFFSTVLLFMLLMIVLSCIVKRQLNSKSDKE